MPVTLVQLKEQVKRESRAKGTDQLDEFVYDVIREIHDQHTERQRFDELLVVDEVLTLTDSNGTVALPDDFQHLQEVRFSTDRSSFHRLDVRGPYHFKRGNYGLPKFFEKTGTSLRFYPYDGIRESMGVQIDYYARANLDSTTAEMPVNKLIPTVRREAISRVHLYYKENPSAQAYKGLAGEAVLGIQSSTETGN